MISEHCAAIGHYILQNKSSLFWTFLCISDSVSCNAVNLYTAAIISFTLHKMVLIVFSFI